MSFYEDLLCTHEEWKEVFEPVDLLFAQKISGKPSLFLAYLLKTAREGHLCVSIDGEKINPSLGSELDFSLIEEARSFHHSEGIVCEENRWYLRQNWECEKRFLEHWERLKYQKPTIPIHLNFSEQMEPEQKQAIEKAAEKTLSLICGGPGTGKTFTARTLVRLFQESKQQEIVLAAPTGKAASNLRSIPGCEVKTLHALLRKRNQLSADLIVIDEGSMIDAQMMTELFASIKNGARLVILGDKDQLPPVGSGNFFADLSEDATYLTKCLRTDLQEIVDLAEKVKRGDQIPYQPLNKDILSEGVHVLTPLKKGPYGVETLNQRFYESRTSEEIPIMITENDHRLELYNGDTGMLRGDTATFPDGRSFSEVLLPKYTYAYVLSVHKSQGSEYDAVRILLPKGSEVFGREMLYTAVTRAKQCVEIWADEGVVEALLSKHSRRLSGISISGRK